MDAERFLLKWNNHQSNLVTVFDQLYEQEAFTDVTLACDGRSFAAHKVILSACSPYFQQLFLSNPCKHPIIFMRDVRANDLDALLAFMYRGEINVHQQDLASFLKTAESLQIKGLSDSSDKPRDTSKILEAMEKKFSSNNNNNHNNNNNNNNHSSYSGFHSANNLAGLSSLIGSAFNRSSPVPSVTNAATMGILSRSLMSHSNSSRDSVTAAPPSKKFKSTTHEDFARILPKMKSLVSQQSSLMSTVPGLMTPISLAATVMKNAAAAASHHQRLSLPSYISSIEENRSPSRCENSSSKDRIKDSGETEIEKDTSEEKSSFQEGYISGDTPHPVYLVSSVGGLGLNSSGNSTPSHEVKVEEEDPLDESNAFSDDPVSLPPSEPNDDQNLGFGDDSLISGKDRLTYPCRFCGKRFTQTGTCRRHERLHTAPNSFKCPFCQKGFNRKYRLKEHIISTHPEQAENKDIAIMVNNSDTTIP